MVIDGEHLTSTEQERLGIAACEPDRERTGYEVTVVFVEVTDDILAVIRDVAGASVVLPG